jgi:hypothetical protein
MGGPDRRVPHRLIRSAEFLEPVGTDLVPGSNSGTLSTATESSDIAQGPVG